METTILLLTLLWNGTLGEQRLLAFAGDVVLVPSGTALEAREVLTGRRVWRYSLVERHGLLNVPCRIQGFQAFPLHPPRIPGLPAPRTAPPHAVCQAGQAELHCLSANDGGIRWKVRKADGCVLALYAVGDVDQDGVEDLVCCGCNQAECFSGRSGAVLWRYTVAGRSLWAGPCGDLDRDGFGEVLLQSSGSLVVLTSPQADRAEIMFPVEGVLPFASLPDRSETGAGFLVAFDGASVWRWKANGKGRHVWDQKAGFLALAATGKTRPLLVTTQGVWRPAAESGWGPAMTFKARAAAWSPEGTMVVADDGTTIHAFPADRRKAVDRYRLPEPVDSLAVDRSGRFVGALTGERFALYRLPGGT